MSEPSDVQVIRSYQRIFRPERRLYQVEGHRLPVPGGVPLRWLAYAIGTLLLVVLVATRSEAVLILAGLAAAAAGYLAGGRAGALLAVASTAVLVFGLGVVLSVLAWPLRLVILPALVATLATQATPDGRPAHRYVGSRVALWLRAERRSAGRPLPAAGARGSFQARLWAVPDERRPWLAHGRVQGPASVSFQTSAMLVRSRRRPRRRQRLARPVTDQRRRGGRARRAVVTSALTLSERESLEVRP